MREQKPDILAVARPHYLDMDATPVSEGIRKIVEFINSHPRTTRKKLLEALAPGTNAAAAQPVPAEAQAAPAGEPTEAQQPVEAQATAPAAPEAAAVVSDLHWLVHQGHVIEFANGILETAKKPAPRPPKPEKKKEEAPTATQGEAEVATQGGLVEGQGTEAEAQGGEQPGDGVEAASVQDESGASAGADVPGGEELPLSNPENKEQS